MTASGTTRLLRRTATVAASAALLCGAVAVAPAAQAAKPGHPAGFHPERDYAGSTVAAHEGRETVPANTFAALAVTQTRGMDVSSWQGNVAWSTAYANGARFAYTKATEGTGYTNPYFAQQYNGSYNVGMIRGAYHFARPDVSSGATQADYFIGHGGGWSADGKTLPGALDIEWNPYGGDCYGLSKASMTNWILSFSNEYHARTNKWPAIYTATSWWTECVGNSDFSSTNPLWVARYASS